MICTKNKIERFNASLFYKVEHPDRDKNFIGGVGKGRR